MFINKLKVENFGPIKAGYEADDGYLSLNQLSVFCGTQGTGKSTLVKLYSTFVWLEKALMRGEMKASYPVQYSRFVKKYLAYHGIDTYVCPDTYIHFKGQCYDFEYKEGTFSLTEHIDNIGYQRPQVMYYPAERNLLSSIVEKASAIKGLPESLLTLQTDYRQACQSMSEDVSLPINKVRFHYDTLNQIGRIVASDHTVRIDKASSGLQSATPLYITLNHLYECTCLGKQSNTTKATSKEQETIDKRIHSLLLDDTIDDTTRSLLIKKLSDNINKRLISIIEEPEQNLFPDSQEKVLYELIRLSAQADNQLLFTTHSPYMINFIMLAIKAFQVAQIATDAKDRQTIDTIVPSGSAIDGEKVSIYQIDLEGNICQLPKYEDIPTDDNYLNTILMNTNTKYSDLVEIQIRYE